MQRSERAGVLAAVASSALGGMAARGMVGLFLGAVLLALGYQIFMGWVYAGQAESDSQPAG